MGYQSDFMAAISAKYDEELLAIKRQLQERGQAEMAKSKNDGFTDPELIKNYKWQLNCINTVLGRRNAKKKSESKNGADGETTVTATQKPDSIYQVQNDNAKAPAFDDALKTKTLDDLNTLKSDIAKGDKTVEGDVAEKIQQIQDEINGRNPQAEALQKDAVNNMKTPATIPTATSGMIRDAAIGTGVGLLAAVVLGKSVIRYAILGAGLGAAYGYFRTHQNPVPVTPTTPSVPNASAVASDVQNYIAQAQS